MTDPWVLHSRIISRSNSVSLRSSGVAFSTGFTEREIRNATRVSFLVDLELHRLGFRFHSDSDPDSYALVHDHKSKSCHSKTLVEKYPWLAQATRMPKPERKFEPLFDSEAKIWFIQIR